MSIWTAYSAEADLTYIMREEAGELEVIGFYAGKPSEELTSIYKDKGTVSYAPIYGHGEISTFYTGGGIWISAKYSDDGCQYYAVDTEYPDCLTCYDHTEEGQEDPFPCQNMVWSVEKKDLSKLQLQTYYKPLLAALKKETEVEA